MTLQMPAVKEQDKRSAAVSTVKLSKLDDSIEHVSDNPGEMEKLNRKKEQLKNDISNMQKQILMLNNEIKSKNALLEKAKKGAAGKGAQPTEKFNH